MKPRVLPFAPLQPSNLQFASGPDSPASPKSPFGLRPRPLSAQDRRSNTSKSSTSSSESSPSDVPPVKPDAWTWKCHQCHSRYPLGATRRCLHDGHYMCSGTTEVSRRSGRVKHMKSCSSEFDYAGWRAYSKWKRQFNRHKHSNRGEKFDECIFPSECRWSPESRAKRLREEEPKATAPEPPVEVGPSPTFDDILGLPVYGETDEYLEPTVSFSFRADHPSPLSSSPNGLATLTTSKLEDSYPDLVLSTSSADSEPTSDPIKPASDRRRSARPSLRNLEKSFERRSARLATLLSPVEEEATAATGGKVSRPTLQFTTYFDRFLKSRDSSHDAPKSTQALEEMEADGCFDEPLQSSVNSIPSRSGQEIDLALRPEEEISYDPTNAHLELEEASGNALFDFNLHQDDESPRRNAWDWTPGHGHAVSTGFAVSSLDDYEEMDID